MKEQKAKLVFVLALVFILSGIIVDSLRLQVGEVARAILPPPLPAAVEVPDTDLIQGVIEAYLWDPERGRNRQPDAESDTDDPVAAVVVDCRLKGIYYGQVYQPLAMFACANQPLKAWREGETLPSQAMIAEIQPDHVVLEKDGEQQNVFLFGKK